ncbi:TrkA C-terminal domain-containing protein [Solitalea lacus]|uniref:TrkA C-terminal domain-containing protein n=1 Tax=Solitalea lacus TaxID=2911172 RepID=UPI001EDAE63C|nr:TrkA C-terminal domain-containing protein [Solitalea lacus]UKJ08664.1 TrkA C-terminal domain-containing protein [Solitalea lacus]
MLSIKFYHPKFAIRLPGIVQVLKVSPKPIIGKNFLKDTLPQLLAIPLSLQEYFSLSNIWHQKISTEITDRGYGQLAIIIAIALMASFLWALSVKRIHSTAYKQLWMDTKYNRRSLITLEIIRILLAIIFIGTLIDQFYSTNAAIISAVTVFGISAMIFSKRLQSFYSKIESRFLANLNDREICEAAKRSDDLMPRDSHLAFFTVNPESAAVGKTLIDLALREQFGVNVAMIERGTKKIKIPEKIERIFPYDRIAVIGTDDQLKGFEKFIETIPLSKEFENTENEQEISLQQITISNHSPLLGKTIKSSGIKENARSLIVGIER